MLDVSALKPEASNLAIENNHITFTKALNEQRSDNANQNMYGGFYGAGSLPLRPGTSSGYYPSLNNPGSFANDQPFFGSQPHQNGAYPPPPQRASTWGTQSAFPPPPPPPSQRRASFGAQPPMSSYARPSAQTEANHVAKIREENSRLKSEIATLQKQYDNQQRKTDKSNVANAIQKEKQNDLSTRIKNQRETISGLQEERDQLLDKVNGWRAAYTEMERKFVAVQAKREEFKTANSGLARENDELHQRIADLEARVRRREDTINRLQDIIDIRGI